jgi:hypothetical protein
VRSREQKHRQAESRVAYKKSEDTLFDSGKPDLELSEYAQAKNKTYRTGKEGASCGP